MLRTLLSGLFILAAANHPSRHTDDGSTRLYVFKHHGIGAYANIVADMNGAEHLGAGTDNDIIAQRGVTLALFPACASQCDTVIEGAIVADFRGFAYDDPHAVINEKAPSYGGAGMNLDAGYPARDIGNHACQPGQAVAKQGVAQAMGEHRM